MGHCCNIAKAMSEANIFANFAVDLFMDAFVDDRLNTHIFDDILNGEVKRDTIFIILYQLSLLFEETALL